MTRIMRNENDAEVAVERRWIALDEGDTLRLRGACGLRVQVEALAGAEAPLLWLTEEGEVDDIFLRAGDVHTLRRAGRVVASAWAPLRVRVAPRAAVAKAPSATAAPCRVAIAAR